MPETLSACALCDKGFTQEALDTKIGVYFEVTSWVHGPKLQSPVLREQTGRKAHIACISKIINGESPDQLPLPGFED